MVELIFENHKVILFLDNATCRPESLHNDLTNIKLMFLPKIQHPDYNLLMQVLSKILKLSTENYFFVLSLVALKIVKLHLK